MGGSEGRDGANAEFRVHNLEFGRGGGSLGKVGVGVVERFLRVGRRWEEEVEVTRALRARGAREFKFRTSGDGLGCDGQNVAILGI